ncbi:MAG: hypothetical protein A2Z50_03350 [Nitrospirae bacterium RBG_19FT_COMBO_42_15]|nr:MAG: hypothetical protein A2Z50_03350 [Nitrospirae bacterium RBG_19FT_COMBO_42_15]
MLLGVCPMFFIIPQRISEVKAILILNSFFPSPLAGEGRVRGKKNMNVGAEDKTAIEEECCKKDYTNSAGVNIFMGVFSLKCFVFHVIKESMPWFASKVHSITASPRRMPLWILEKHSETSAAQKSLALSYLGSL